MRLKVKDSLTAGRIRYMIQLLLCLLSAIQVGFEVTSPSGWITVLKFSQDMRLSDLERLK